MKGIDKMQTREKQSEMQKCSIEPHGKMKGNDKRGENTEHIVCVVFPPFLHFPHGISF